MSEYKIGTVIEFRDKNYIVLKNLTKGDFEYHLIIPVGQTGQKWEDIANQEDLQLEYDKLIVLTHDLKNDSFEFEADEKTANEVFKEMTKEN